MPEVKNSLYAVFIFDIVNVVKYKFYPTQLFNQARNLRREGLSLTEIAKALNVRSSAVSRWCNDIESTNPYHNHIVRKKDITKNINRELIKRLEIDTESAKILSSMLYWCEGSKYPSSNFIAFSNSDQALVKTFLELFRRGFKPIEDKIKVHLQLHTTHDVPESTKFWSNLLCVPKAQFYKPTITEPANNMKRINYRGTCTVRYYSVGCLWEITGAFEEFSKKFYNKQA